jgi:hypothetical protein
MQISLEKLNIYVTGLVVIGLVIGTLYLFFTIFFNGPKADPVPVLTSSSAGSFGPKLQKAATAIVGPEGAKVELNRQKNLQFLDSALFQSFVDEPVTVPLSKIRGRSDPFVPYVAP